MIKGSEEFGFTLEAGNPVGVLGKFLWQDFDRYITSESSVLCPEDFTHSTLADV